MKNVKKLNLINIFIHSKKISKDQYSHSKKTISMNWHSIGEYVRRKKKDALVIDFGSTTTDFLCIKNGIIMNQNFMIFQDSEWRINIHGINANPYFCLRQIH